VTSYWCVRVVLGDELREGVADLVDTIVVEL
jgi:hypothetical protein